MNNHNENITLSRDCEATLIPFGNSFTLKKGDEVKITQALGGSYTVMARGSLFRIESKDADAIGKEIIETSDDKNEITGYAVKKDVWDVLKTCYDPEIPVNMVDLGLIYSCELKNEKKGGTNIEIKMTLTAPGCGMGPAIAEDARNKVFQVPGIFDVNIHLVWDPQWNRDMMTEEAKLQLGLL